MKLTEMRTALQTKNNLLIQQTRRIVLLEEKMTDWRKKYFQLKYASFNDESKVVLEETMAITS